MNTQWQAEVRRLPWADASVLIATHVFVKGAPQELFEFLQRKRLPKIVFIGQPLYVSEDLQPFCERYEKGELVERYSQPSKSGPEPFRFLCDFLRTIRWARRQRGQFDLAVGANGLNALACLSLRRLGKVRRVVFYTIDFVPKRFGSKVMNILYHWVDRFCVRHADIVWNLSPRMVDARQSAGLAPEFCSKQLVVPVGVQLHTMRRRSWTEIDRFRVAYLGHLVERQGVLLLIEAIPCVLRYMPQARFLIVGGGPQETLLKQEVFAKNIDKVVEFTGLVRERSIVEELVSKCALGVAPYVPNKDNFSFYADPTKPKDYLGMGLPVIITDVPAVARLIADRQAGILIPYDASALCQAIVRLLNDDYLLKRYRENAILLAAEFDWDRIFTSALEVTWSRVFERS